MFPIMLNLELLPTALVGNGKQTVRRLGLLDEAGAAQLTIYSEAPSPELEKAAGERLIKRLPTKEEIAKFSFLLVVDIEEEKAAELAGLARKHKTVVNVEDNRPYCDFFFSSIVRRGDLVLTVSTAGKSPTLARRIKELLEKAFPEEWIERVALLGQKRDEWKKEPEATMPIVMAQTDEFLKQEGWLGDNVCPRHRNK